MDEVMKIKAKVLLDDLVIKTRITDTSKGGTDNYNDLYNLPTLNGVVIKGDMEEIDPTVPEWAKQENKPEYTVEEIDNALDRRNELSDEAVEAMVIAAFLH